MDRQAILTNFMIPGKFALVEVIEVFVSFVPGYIMQIQDDWNRKDIEAFKKSVNKLKGSVGNFYQMNLVNDLKKLELMTDDSTTIITHEFMTKTLTATKSFVTELKEFQDELLSNMEVSESLREITF
ncbi:MAG: hypothetical protein JXR48_14785 [Candidatus Delongbacteria bacterium]|nr:hypothetical protein [Candidatus Delongbacteria bacterium]MBN2836223.1 hypothetical protein [Candidatus Delongbacteria bacterium]